MLTRIHTSAVFNTLTSSLSAQPSLSLFNGTSSNFYELRKEQAVASQLPFAPSLLLLPLWVLSAGRALQREVASPTSCAGAATAATDVCGWRWMETAVVPSLQEDKFAGATRLIYVKMKAVGT